MTSSGASARPRDATFFLASAWLRPLLILLQLLLVGLALFEALAGDRIGHLAERSRCRTSRCSC